MGADRDENAEAYKLEEQIGFLLRLCNQRHAAIFQAHTLQGLTPTQFAALSRIAEEGEVSQNQLGRLAAMDVATIKGVVDRLNEKGLTMAKPDLSDKRRNVISLTSQGEELLREMQKVGRKITAETLAPLDGEEAQKIVELLRKLS